MQRPHFSRRQFLKASAVLAAAGSVAPSSWSSGYCVASEPKSKNERPQFAAVGVGDEGTVICAGADWWGGKGACGFADPVAVCDVDQRRADTARAAFAPKAAVYTDYRKVLDRNDVEAVVIATPDHWHAKIAVEAMRAGKDVYCEKPLALTIDEGKLLCKIAEQTGAVFQVGAQQRSDARFRLAVDLVRNGRIGKLRRVVVKVPEQHGKRGGPFRSQPVPADLNWDFWLGQAPWADYCPERCHHYFRGWFEYSGGLVTDWGAHHIDIVHWALDCEKSGPVSIDGKGTLPHIPGGMNTPTSFAIDYVYPNGVPVHYRSDLKENGILFEGDEGRLFVNRGRISGKPVEKLAKHPLPESTLRVEKSDNHMGNFFACVKNRQRPISDIWTGHRVATALHLANISIRLGRKLQWDPAKEKVVGDDEANGWLRRSQRSPYQILH
jgi:myo-inositol 2-dehydrogenase / D-chiro-inositol 1-dehydrogenase